MNLWNLPILVSQDASKRNIFSKCTVKVTSARQKCWLGIIPKNATFGQSEWFSTCFCAASCPTMAVWGNNSTLPLSRTSWTSQDRSGTVYRARLKISSQGCCASKKIVWMLSDAWTILISNWFKKWRNRGSTSRRAKRSQKHLKTSERTIPIPRLDKPVLAILPSFSWTKVK